MRGTSAAAARTSPAAVISSWAVWYAAAAAALSSVAAASSPSAAKSAACSGIGSRAGTLRTARRHSSSASPWADIALASRAAATAYSYAGPAHPACSKWAEMKAPR